MSKRRPFPYAAAALIDESLMNLADIARTAVKIGKRSELPGNVHCEILDLLIKVQDTTEKLKQVRAMRPE